MLMRRPRRREIRSAFGPGLPRSPAADHTLELVGTARKRHSEDLSAVLGDQDLVLGEHRDVARSWL